MWSATRPQSVGRYGWRPSPAEPGRPVDIVDPGGTQSQLLTIDATGHLVEGGEWWQGPTLYAWEESVNAELLEAYRDLVQRIDNSRPCSMGGIHNAREVQFGIEEIHRWRELIERCEQQPADTRDATIERMRAALERIAKWHGEFPATTWQGKPCSYDVAYGSNGERDYMREVARAALGDKP